MSGESWRRITRWNKRNKQKQENETSPIIQKIFAGRVHLAEIYVGRLIFLLSQCRQDHCGGRCLFYSSRDSVSHILEWVQGKPRGVVICLPLPLCEDGPSAVYSFWTLQSERAWRDEWSTGVGLFWFFSRWLFPSLSCWQCCSPKNRPASLRMRKVS